MPELKTIIVISKDLAMLSIIRELLQQEYGIVEFHTIEQGLKYVHVSSPDAVLSDITSKDDIIMLNNLKSEPIMRHLPVIGIIDDGFQYFGSDAVTQISFLPPEKWSWRRILLDDYVKRAALEKDIVLRMGLCLERAERTVEINPLTRLPGNITIMKEIQERIDKKEDFALAYADLDNFKPYNDRYGFAKGDEMLKMTGRLILNTVKQQQAENSFVGHIGGDDFVFFTDRKNIRTTAEKILGFFERIIPTFYEEQDRERKFMESVDRAGTKRTFGFVSLSIGVAYNSGYTHYGEMAAAASELKKFAKTVDGNSLKFERRRGKPA
jgi:diguanylate cyclase (GGDEF)-like protein